MCAGEPLTDCRADRGGIDTVAATKGNFPNRPAGGSECNRLSLKTPEVCEIDRFIPAHSELPTIHFVAESGGLSERTMFPARLWIGSLFGIVFVSRSAEPCGL